MTDNPPPSKMAKYGFVFLFILIAASCEDEPKVLQSDKSIAQQLNESRFSNSSQQIDAQFLVSSSEMSMRDIRLGQLAQKTAYHADVRELGKMMVHSHSKILSELIMLAKTKSISIPSYLTAENDAPYNKLSKKNGENFDIAYCELMIMQHRKAIEIFEKMSINQQVDADIKAWSMASLQELRTHLEYAVICKEKM